MDVMADVEDIDGYFASISGLSNRIISDIELIRQVCIQNGEWNDLTLEEQEAIIDRYVIDPAVVEKYSTGDLADEQPSCFPFLKIPCGEKIVVDFDHDDGWTWTDEHSAPFSWKTRSQQDLTFADLDEMLSTKDEPGKKGRNFAKRPRSPDRSVWDTPFVNGDKSKNEIEQMFEKFGIKMTSDGEEIIEDAGQSETDGRINKEYERNTSAIFADFEKDLNDPFSGSGTIYENRSFSVIADEPGGFSFGTDSLESSPSRSLLKTSESLNQCEEDMIGIAAAAKSKKKKHHEKKEKKHRSTKDKRNREERGSIVSETSKNSTTRHSVAVPVCGDICFGTVRLNPAEYAQQVSVSTDEFEASTPLPQADYEPYYDVDVPEVHGSCLKINFAEAPGESSTDDFLQTDVPYTSGHEQELSVPELLPSTSPCASDSGVGSAMKTGFDFLDNW